MNIKKILYSSWHRGTREMDLLLGRFADANLKSFSNQELIFYELLLQEDDADIFMWITGKYMPDFPLNIIVKRIKAFYNSLS